MIVEIEATEIDIVDNGFSLFGPKINKQYQKYLYNTVTGNLFDLKWNNIGKYNFDGYNWNKCYIYLDITEKSKLNSYLRIDPKYDVMMQNSPYIYECRKKALEIEQEDI